LLFQVFEFLSSSLLLLNGILLQFSAVVSRLLGVNFYSFAQLVHTFSKLYTSEVHLFVDGVLVLNQLQGVLSVIDWRVLSCLGLAGRKLGVNLKGSPLLDKVESGDHFEVAEMLDCPGSGTDLLVGLLLVFCNLLFIILKSIWIH